MIGLFLCLSLCGAVGAAPAEPRVYRDHVEPHWFGGNTRFWYRDDLPDGRRQFVLVDATIGERRPAFDQSKAAASLSELTKSKVDPERLPVDWLHFSDDGKTVGLRGRTGTWVLDLKTYKVSQTREKEDDSDLPHLEASQDSRPSRRTGEPTRVTFINQTKSEVSLYWLNEEGEREAYGTVAAGARRERHTYAGHVWLAAGRGGEVIAVFRATDEPALAIVDEKDVPVRPRRRRQQTEGAAAVASPNGRFEAFVRDGNLWLRDQASREEHPLSDDATAENTYHFDVYRDRAIGLNYTLPERPESLPEVYWSPDSKRLVAIRTRTVVGRDVHWVESSPRDQLQPRLHAYPYLKAGDEIPIRKPHLFDVEQRREIRLDESLFPNPWDVSDIRWSPDSGRFTFLYNQRGHQVLRVIGVDAKTGETKAIIDEHSDTFIDYSGKYFCEHLDDSGEIIWMSERGGWNHLYLYDAKTGSVKNAINSGSWVVRGVDHVDAQKRQIWFRAGGIRPEQDPYFVHLCRVNFDGSNLVVLTEGNGTHTTRLSPDQHYLVDTWSRVDAPPVTELRRCDDGKLACKLEEADASEVLAKVHRLPEPFVAKSRDWQTDIYGVIYRPSDFNTNKKYSVIENIYAGPQDSYVPKAFRPSFPQQALADEGYIVVQIDGMGTSNRSKKFHDVCWRNLGDAGFPDRIAWIKAAAEKYPQLDLTRVGIYGTSAGGQNALGGLLAHGDFYTCGVADSGCHDNRMDKIWWNEQWMGWPIGPWYAEQSNVTHAGDLRGPLLLTVGEADQNVDPASTMQVVNALIKADKDFEVLVVPGAGHGVLSTSYGRRRMRDFFARHLLHASRPPETETR